VWLQKGKRKNLIAGASMAGFARSIQASRGVTKDAELRESYAKIPNAIKMRILFFYPTIVRYSLVREDHLLEKLNR
jgi:hypothetical protein